MARLGRPQPDDLHLAVALGVVDPVVEAAALERVMKLARAVGRQDDDRRRLGGHGADLGDRDGAVGEHLQQEGLELLVGPVELVHEQHRTRARAHGRQQRPLDEELGPVQLGRLAVGVERALLQRPGVEQLARVVPLVERLAGVDALVALQADQPGLQDPRQRARDLGLADPRLALEQQRPAQPEGEEDGHREAAVGDVALAREGLLKLLDVGEIHGDSRSSGRGAGHGTGEFVIMLTNFRGGRRVAVPGATPRSL